MTLFQSNIRSVPRAFASLADQAAAITRFGRFFLGQLWDSYGADRGRDE